MYATEHFDHVCFSLIQVHPVKPPAVSPQTDRAVLTLREMILRGDFRPSERISEVPLPARLNLSRALLQFALDRHCHEGLLERERCDRVEETIPVAADPVGQRLECNNRFHVELTRLAKSAIVAGALQRIFSDAEHAHSPKVAVIAHEQHRAMVEATGNREGTPAEALAREHSRRARKKLTRPLADKQLPGNLRGAPLVRLSAALAPRRKRRRSSS
jgi:DNA-binding GntR family transcriptional regulator